jgi:hypothetical protein
MIGQGDFARSGIEDLEGCVEEFRNIPTAKFFSNIINIYK